MADINSEYKKMFTPGQAEYQIIVFTKNINKLAEHFKNNNHDYCASLCLQKTLVKRRTMLDYLKKNSYDRYLKIFTSLKNKEIR